MRNAIINELLEREIEVLETSGNLDQDTVVAYGILAYLIQAQDIDHVEIEAYVKWENRDIITNGAMFTLPLYETRPFLRRATDICRMIDAVTGMVEDNNGRILHMNINGVMIPVDATVGLLEAMKKSSVADARDYMWKQIAPGIVLDIKKYLDAGKGGAK